MNDSLHTVTFPVRGREPAALGQGTWNMGKSPDRRDREIAGRVVIGWFIPYIYGDMLFALSSWNKKQSKGCKVRLTDKDLKTKSTGSPPASR